MADDDLLHAVSCFLSTEDRAAAPLELEEVDSQQLLADTDALLLSVNQSKTAAKTASKTKKDVAREKAGQRRDAYRRRLKAEWATLRQQDAALSKQLETLQQRKTQEETQSCPTDSLALGAWRAIAMRQYESRTEAQALQRRLQAAVNSRAVLIQDLESVLSKRVREVEKMATVEVPDVLEKKARLGTRDATLYNTYFQNLDALYERLEEVFEQVGVTPTAGGILSGEPTRKMHGETEFFETVGVGRVPFSFQRTCDAVWELSSVAHRQEGRRVYDGLPDPDNSMALQFCSPLERENGEVLKLRTYHVARRYVEKNRMVLVWRALCEADGEFPGMNSDETGWCVVHSPESDPDFFADPTTTLVQACIRMVPMHFQDGSAEKEGKVDQFMELLVKTGVEDNREIDRMMERLLLDDALATDGLEIDADGNLTSVGGR
ncbi:hypothetical protein PHYPSEUDO_002084 [Phytophthora pseudosyringae]|uniref:M96 mating-specific protein family n=1 Tax=Phytophthora pseudosyringae TaxID=221518 RepID=A0A8T1VXF6_9STRA|nr:hypothetical protein PHYPSEUDO_002084 [Phytophthora pseudosyringae]